VDSRSSYAYAAANRKEKRVIDLREKRFGKNLSSKKQKTTVMMFMLFEFLLSKRKINIACLLYRFNL
jgi:hypothetical protein